MKTQSKSSTVVNLSSSKATDKKSGSNKIAPKRGIAESSQTSNKTTHNTEKCNNTVDKQPPSGETSPDQRTQQQFSVPTHSQSCSSSQIQPSNLNTNMSYNQTDQSTMSSHQGQRIPSQLQFPHQSHQSQNTPTTTPHHVDFSILPGRFHGKYNEHCVVLQFEGLCPRRCSVTHHNNSPIPPSLRKDAAKTTVKVEMNKQDEGKRDNLHGLSESTNVGTNMGLSDDTTTKCDSGNDGNPELVNCGFDHDVDSYICPYHNNLPLPYQSAQFRYLYSQPHTASSSKPSTDIGSKAKNMAALKEKKMASPIHPFVQPTDFNLPPLPRELLEPNGAVVHNSVLIEAAERIVKDPFVSYALLSSTFPNYNRCPFAGVQLTRGTPPVSRAINSIDSSDVGTETTKHISRHHNSMNNNSSAGCTDAHHHDSQSEDDGRQTGTSLDNPQLNELDESSHGNITLFMGQTPNHSVTIEDTIGVVDAGTQTPRPRNASKPRSTPCGLSHRSVSTAELKMEILRLALIEQKSIITTSDPPPSRSSALKQFKQLQLQYRTIMVMIYTQYLLEVNNQQSSQHSQQPPSFSQSCDFPPQTSLLLSHSGANGVTNGNNAGLLDNQFLPPIPLSFDQFTAAFPSFPHLSTTPHSNPITQHNPQSSLLFDPLLGLFPISTPHLNPTPNLNATVDASSPQFTHPTNQRPHSSSSTATSCSVPYYPVSTSIHPTDFNSSGAGLSSIHLHPQHPQQSQRFQTIVPPLNPTGHNFSQLGPNATPYYLPTSQQLIGPGPTPSLTSAQSHPSPAYNHSISSSTTPPSVHYTPTMPPLYLDQSLKPFMPFPTTDLSASNQYPQQQQQLQQQSLSNHIAPSGSRNPQYNGMATLTQASDNLLNETSPTGVMLTKQKSQEQHPTPLKIASSAGNSPEKASSNNKSGKNENGTNLTPNPLAKAESTTAGGLKRNASEGLHLCNSSATFSTKGGDKNNNKNDCEQQMSEYNNATPGVFSPIHNRHNSITTFVQTEKQPHPILPPAQLNPHLSISTSMSSTTLSNGTINNDTKNTNQNNRNSSSNNNNNNNNKAVNIDNNTNNKQQQQQQQQQQIPFTPPTPSPHPNHSIDLQYAMQLGSSYDRFLSQYLPSLPPFQIPQHMHIDFCHFGAYAVGNGCPAKRSNSSSSKTPPQSKNPHHHSHMDNQKICKYSHEYANYPCPAMNAVPVPPYFRTIRITPYHRNDDLTLAAFLIMDNPLISLQSLFSAYGSTPHVFNNFDGFNAANLVTNAQPQKGTKSTQQPTSPTQITQHPNFSPNKTHYGTCLNPSCPFQHVALDDMHIKLEILRYAFLDYKFFRERSEGVPGKKLFRYKIIFWAFLERIWYFHYASQNGLLSGINYLPQDKTKSMPVGVFGICASHFSTLQLTMVPGDGKSASNPPKQPQLGSHNGLNNANMQYNRANLLSPGSADTDRYTTAISPYSSATSFQAQIPQQHPQHSQHSQHMHQQQQQQQFTNHNSNGFIPINTNNNNLMYQNGGNGFQPQMGQMQSVQQQYSNLNLMNNNTAIQNTNNLPKDVNNTNQIMHFNTTNPSYDHQNQFTHNSNQQIDLSTIAFNNNLMNNNHQQPKRHGSLPSNVGNLQYQNTQGFDANFHGFQNLGLPLNSQQNGMTMAQYHQNTQYYQQSSQLQPQFADQQALQHNNREFHSPLIQHSALQPVYHGNTNHTQNQYNTQYNTQYNDNNQIHLDTGIAYDGQNHVSNHKLINQDYNPSYQSQQHHHLNKNNQNQAQYNYQRPIGSSSSSTTPTPLLIEPSIGQNTAYSTTQSTEQLSLSYTHSLHSSTSPARTHHQNTPPRY